MPPDETNKPPPQDEKPKTDEKPKAELKAGSRVTCFRLGNGLSTVRSPGVVKRIRRIKERDGECMRVDIAVAIEGGETLVEGALELSGAPDFDAVRFGPRFTIDE